MARGGRHARGGCGPVRRPPAPPAYPRNSSHTSSHAWVVSGERDSKSMRSSLPWNRPAIASTVSARKSVGGVPLAEGKVVLGRAPYSDYSP